MAYAWIKICYDNAISEIFFHSQFKVECLYDDHFNNRREAKEVIFKYVNIYFNKNRKHSTVGQKTLAQFESLNLKAS